MSRKRVKHYTLGHVWDKPGWFREIVYIPSRGEFALCSGYSTDYYGSVGDASEVLQRYEEEFVSLCPWFVPILKRMAAGECVHIHTIRSAHRKAKGEELPSQTK